MSGPPRDAGHSDPGLQPERTTLAWYRTALASSVIALLLLRSLARSGPVLLGLAVLSWALAVGAYISASITHRRRVRGICDEKYPRTGWAVTSLTLSTIALAGGALHLAAQGL